MTATTPLGGSPAARMHAVVDPAPHARSPQCVAVLGPVLAGETLADRRCPRLVERAEDGGRCPVHTTGRPAPAPCPRDGGPCVVDCGGRPICEDRPRPWSAPWGPA